MAKKEFTGVKINTPECVLLYPAVFEAKFNDLKGKDEWAVTMLFDKANSDMNAVKAAMIQAAKNEFGADVDLKTLDMKRIQDGDAVTSTGRERHEACKGMWVVKAATRLNAPGVVDAKVQKILDPSEIYSGVHAVVNVTAKAYAQPSRGVTFYLNHVQKVKDGDPLTGGPVAEDVFSALEIDENQVEAVEDGMDGMFS